jgi:hypothetical protein
MEYIGCEWQHAAFQDFVDAALGLHPNLKPLQPAASLSSSFLYSHPLQVRTPALDLRLTIQTIAVCARKASQQNQTPRLDHGTYLRGRKRGCEGSSE